ncbi:MAG: MFS transporter [Ardenticatenales bacterium]|nr:MFS transporter [Ardenticatenales bacterium]
MSQYWRLLRTNRNYRLLWLGALISNLGDWFNLIASAALVAQLTTTGTAISYLFLARFLPLFFFSPIAGVLADRYSRQAIMIVTDVLRALIVLGFLLIRDPSQIWLLYLLTVSQFVLSALFTPARSAVLANVVRTEELVTANALDSLTWSTMLAVGSMLGGVVAALFGGTTAFVVDAGTFFLSAWFISRITNIHQSSADLVARRGWLAFLDGLRYLRGAPAILALSLVKGGGSLVWGAVNVLEVNFAEKIFPLGGHNSTATLGIIYTISGLGTGLGPLLLRRVFGDEPARARWAITSGFVLLTTGLFVLSMAPTLPVFALGTLIRTIGSGTIWVFSAALLQMLVPDRVRGRVFAFEFAFLTLTQSISIFWAGYGQDTLHLGVRQVTALMGWVGVAVLGLWFLLQLRVEATQAAVESQERAS